ncbi:MAG: hypothetical protein MUE72_11545 [Chitinophagaceae bacterium]|jgi:hypothetical protein|nr:hypothetical protein [Chitinophagaceae bacterium]
MKTLKKILLNTLAIVVFTLSSLAQSPSLSPKQFKYKLSMQNFVDAILKNNNEAIISPLFYKQHLYDNNWYGDTTTKRGKETNAFTQQAILSLKKYVLKSGLENLDVAPIDFFKNDTLYKKNFKDIQDDILFYYDKRNPELPLGPIWFEPKTNQIICWLVLNFGGELFFITPSFLNS